MRIMGGIAALMICVLWGNSKAAALRMRYDALHNFARDISALAAEMEYRPRDIRDMAQGLYSGELGDFWRGFTTNMEKHHSAEKAWIQASREHSGFDMLSSHERMLIAEAGRSIGKLNAKDSAKTLRHWGEQAEKCAQELSVQIKNKGAAYQKLGLLGGLAVMLLVV